ncbi:site-specific integrase [Nocardiopsis sp. CNT-189]|uniref:tyrosine-type recombinase/integrase n=1 Tax=Nocardiopsis oceanisediminis TaxID=2816862 RepID=UPI003B352D47
MADTWPAGEMREGIRKVERKRESKRSGRTVYAYKVPYRTPAGKQTSETWSTLKEARAFRDQVRSQKRAGILPDYQAGEVSVASWSAEWLEAVKTSARDSTYRTYRAWLNRHVIPALGDSPVRAVTSSDVQRAVNRWAKTLSPRSVHLTYKICCALFGTAVEAEKRSKTPCRAIMLPELPESEVVPFTLAEVDALEEAVPPDWRLLVVLGAGTGLRMGEMLGLTWDRIDFKARTVTVDRQLQKGKLVAVKSKKSRRTVPLPARVALALQAHAARFPRRPVDAPDAAAGTSTAELVFYRVRGGRVLPVCQSTARDRFKAACKAVGVQGAPKVHTLRHTFASLLIARNVPGKRIQAWMGHASFSVTMDVYGHLYDDPEGAQSAAIDDALGVPEGSSGVVGPGPLTP